MQKYILNIKYLFLLLIVIGTVSCSQYQKLLKSSDNELKYNKAVELYEAGKYSKGLQLFEQIQPLYRGTEKAQDIAYYISYSNYKLKDYIIAGYYLRVFSNNFPNHPKAEEAAFLSAYCSYLDSPISKLDQKLTHDAIASLESFKIRYPQSEYISKSNELLYELKSKLEKKTLDQAMLYYQLQDYRAAIITFNNMLKDFPDTKYKEEIMYYVLLSKYDYAINSVESKKAERFSEVVNAYQSLLEGFPNGEYINKAETLKNTIFQYQQ